MAASEPNSMHFEGDQSPGCLPVVVSGSVGLIGIILLAIPTFALLAGSSLSIGMLVTLGPMGLYVLVISRTFAREVHSVDLQASPREAHVLLENVLTGRKKMRHFRIPDDARVVLKEDNDGAFEVTIDGLPRYVDFVHLKRASTAAPVALPALEHDDQETLKELVGDKGWAAFHLTREIAGFLGLKPEGEVRFAVWRKG